MNQDEPFALIPTQTATELIAAYRHLAASGFLSPGRIEELLRAEPRIVEDPIHFRNDSGEEIPRYGCVQLTGTVETDDRNIFIGDKPADSTGDAGPFVFNGHHAVAIGDTGTAQRGRVVRAISDGSAMSAGDRWQPVVGDWTIEPGGMGPYIMAGPDALVTDGCKVIINPLRCCGECRVGADNFNRADENPVTGNWTEISGDWRVNSNELDCVSDGILITSLRQAAPTRTGAGYANYIGITLDGGGGTVSEWHIITNFTDSNNFWWIQLYTTGGTIYPRFYTRSGGADTLVMDLTTHPLGVGWTLVSDRLRMFVCTSDIEWSIRSELSEEKWQTCAGDVVTALPATGSHGLVGFKKGRYDDFEYDIHWESQLNCPVCNCTCFISNDNAACIPETLVLTLVPASGPYDWGSGSCSTPANITLGMYQQSPVTAAVPTPPTFGAARKTPRKYIWYSDLLHGESGPAPIHSAWPWLILVCDTFRGQAYLLVREYPDSSVTTDPPVGSGLMPYWETEETDLVNGAKRFDLAESDCTPISMVFKGLAFPRSAMGQCDIRSTVVDVYITE